MGEAILSNLRRRVHLKKYYFILLDVLEFASFIILGWTQKSMKLFPETVYKDNKDFSFNIACADFQFFFAFSGATLIKFNQLHIITRHSLACYTVHEAQPRASGDNFVLPARGLAS